MDEKKRIEMIMDNERMNSAQFVIEIGIQGSTLSHILNGRNKPSLEVLKKILSRFKNISSDWLILGTLPMYRIDKNIHEKTLFDQLTPSEKTINKLEPSIEYKDSLKIPSSKADDSSNHTPQYSNSVPQVNPMLSTNTLDNKKIKKIIIYFSDNTFQEFNP